MSRVIKFRALFEQERDLGNVLRWEFVGVNESMDRLVESVLNQKSPWLQFTGLKDKNGNEIYEGDIIEINHPFKNRSFTGDVQWLGYLFGCKGFSFPHFDVLDDIFYEGTEYIQVVGNIYEQRCPECKGTGEVERTIFKGGEGMKIEMDVPFVCGECNGSGKVKKEEE